MVTGAERAGEGRGGRRGGAAANEIGGRGAAGGEGDGGDGARSALTRERGKGRTDGKQEEGRGGGGRAVQERGDTALFCPPFPRCSE